SVGFSLVPFGRAITAVDFSGITELNTKWDAVRSGVPLDASGTELGYPIGSIGWVYKKAMATRAASRRNLGMEAMSSNKNNYVRCWKHLRRFAHRKPGSVTDREILDLQAELLKSWKYEARKTLTLWSWICDRAAEYGLMPPRRPGSRHTIQNPMPQGRDKF